MFLVSVHWLTICFALSTAKLSLLFWEQTCQVSGQGRDKSGLEKVSTTDEVNLCLCWLLLANQAKPHIISTNHYCC